MGEAREKKLSAGRGGWLTAERSRFAAAPLYLTLLCSCGAHTSPSSKPAAAAPALAPAPAPAPALAPAPAPAPAAPSASAPAIRCGNFSCQFFSTPSTAFSEVLESSPRILAIGEAHALAGTETVESATRRFTRDFLPLLHGRATDIVVELLLPNKKCQKESAQAKENQKVVTEKQASTDQNEYVALANQARALDIRPHALEPTCDDLSRIAGAGQEAVAASLDVITRLSREALEKLYTDNAAASDAMVVAYGGAMHNDLAPRPGREQWSFGPALATLTNGRYVELDLIVPEFISDSPAWKSLPWIDAFDPKAHPESTTLLSPAKDSFVLVFPRTP